MLRVKHTEPCTTLAVCMLMLSAAANAFLVSDFEGNRVETNDYLGEGRWTVVMLWQLDCIPCEEQKPAVEAFHKKYKDSSAHVVGLVLDGHEKMSAIKQFVDKSPTAFPTHVVFGDVFRDQISEETGKVFYTAPGYIVYAPNGELKMSIDRPINVNDLISYIEDQFGS